jgi:MFS family permease
MAVIPRERWKHIIPAALVVYFFNFMDKVNIGFAVPGITAAFKVTPAQIGNLMGVTFIGFMLLQIPTGYLVELWSAKKWIVVLLVGWSISGMLSGLSQNMTQMYWTRFLMGVFEGGVWPAVVVLIGNWFPREERATAQSMWEISLPIAAMITAPVSGFLTPLVGWRWMLILETAPPLLWAIVWWKMVEDKPAEAKWLSATERQYIEERLQQEHSNVKPVPLNVSWKAMIHPFTLHLGFVYMLTLMGTFGLSLWGPTIMRELGAGYMKAGLLLAIPNFFTIWVMIYTGHLSDRLQKRKIVIAAVLLGAAIGFFCMGIFGKTAIWLMILFMTISTAGIFARQGPLWAIPRQVLPPGALGLAVAVIGMIGNFGGYAGPWMMGYVNNKTHSFTAGFYCLAMIFVVASILILLVNERKRISFGKEKIEGIHAATHT